MVLEIEVLRRVRLLRDLGDDELEALAAGGERKSFKDDALVFREGDEATGLFVILSGRVRLDRQHGSADIELLTLGPGGSLGEPALFDPAPRTATAVTVEPTEFLVIDRAQFLECIAQSPQALALVLAGLGSELRGAHDTVFWEMLERHALRADMEAERYRSLAQLVAGVAHEVNTPLGVIITAASVLTEELGALGPLAGAAASPALERAVEAAELIQGNVTRANSLVQKFKSLSVSQAVDVVEPVDLDTLVDEILSLYAPQARAGRLQVEFCDHRADRSRPWIGNAGHLTQVLLNLLSNVDRYAYPDGEPGVVEIVLDDHTSADSFELTVRDFGRGIPPDDLTQVLEPFFTTGRAQGGTGLGLAIVHSLVTTGMQGSVQIDSEPGRGTAVQIVLPNVAVDDAPETSARHDTKS